MGKKKKILTAAFTVSFFIIIVIAVAVMKNGAGLSESSDKIQESSGPPGESDTRQEVAYEPTSDKDREEEEDTSLPESGGLVASGTEGKDSSSEPYQEYDYSSLDTIEAPEKFEPNLSVNGPDSDADLSLEEEAKKELVCEAFGRFTGQYPEDKRDEPVENVAAVLITNSTDRYLEYATLTFDIDGKAANFIVTGLPAGKSAWVMEANRLVIGENAVFTYQNCISAFCDEVVSFTDQIKIQVDGNMMTAANRSQKTLENVVVYYRILHTDGNYLGGVTYTASFERLEPGEAAESLAGHYSAGDCEIVRIDWQGT